MHRRSFLKFIMPFLLSLSFAATLFPASSLAADSNVIEITESLTEQSGELPKGDIDGDGEVTNKDVTRLFRYLSGWHVEVNEKAIDVNGDGKVNNKDIVRLFQFVSGWNVEIY